VSHTNRWKVGFVVLGLILAAKTSRPQVRTEPNSEPNPYRTIANWAHLPVGRVMGQVSAVDVDRRDHVWVADRCGGTSCDDSPVDPIMEFDASGKLLNSFGRGLFVYPHGIGVDKDGNVWVTDGQGSATKGHQGFKFSPAGKVLLVLGKRGVPGNGPDTFNQPSDVLVGPNGDVFVVDGHAPGYINARIVKYSKDGKFLQTWGKRGSGPGEFEGAHGLAMDSKGRLFVADRSNNRIEIFDQNGKYLDQWKQFGRPGGLFIDRNDVLYVADSESTDRKIAWSGPWSILPQGYGYNPGWKRGIRVGSARDGSVTAFIPDPHSPIGSPDDPTSAAEGVAADSTGAIYGAEVGQRDVKKYVRTAANH